MIGIQKIESDKNLKAKSLLPYEAAENTYYSYFKEQLYHDDIGEYEAYGICIETPDGCAVKMHDIFLNETDIRKLTDMLNRCQPSMVHLKDIVEDALV